jgi:hypothetical protein
MIILFLGIEHTIEPCFIKKGAPKGTLFMFNIFRFLNMLLWHITCKLPVNICN